jgi:CheY-like chemotaxis protein
MRLQRREFIDLLAERSQAAEGQPRVRQLRAKPGVLVADDDHLVRVMVQLGLERSGFEVWLASNGREAIGLYQKHRDSVDVVLLDVHMAGLDGPQTLDVLRQLNPQIPVCFMSCNSDPYQPEELRQRGAAYVLAKPFRLNQLADILRCLANGGPTELVQSDGASQG